MGNKLVITTDFFKNTSSISELLYYFFYRTSPDLGVSVNNQAVSGLDFVSQKAIAVLQENVTRVAVSIVIKQVKKTCQGVH